MRIFNVVEIYDDGESVSIATETGSVIHLPKESGHSITIVDIKEPNETHSITVLVELYHK